MKIHPRHVSQRWVLAVMGMLGMTMAYMMRACLGITLTQMVKPVLTGSGLQINISSEKSEQNYCPMPDDFGMSNRTAAVVAVDSSERFDWDEKTQGMVLSAFFYGYIITHLPFGILVQNIGGKFIMGFGLLFSAIFTLMTPTVARMGSTPLIIVRFIEGLGEGAVFPSMFMLLARWAPPEEKGMLSTLVFAGITVGNIFGNLLSGFIIHYVPGGWPNVFYFFGSITIVWFVFWCMLVYNDPKSHPLISDAELEYLQNSIGSLERKKDLPDTPWKSILTSGPLWAAIISGIGADWGGYTIGSDLPKYMNDVLHFSVTENGVLSSILYLVQWTMMVLSGILADLLVSKRVMGITAVRKTYAIIGTFGPGLGVVCASFIGCNKMMAILCFTVSMALWGFCVSSICINPLDLSPNYASTLIALANSIGCLSGMASPYITGLLVPNRTLLEWRLVFWTMLIIMTSTSVIYVLFGSGEVQTWNDPAENDCPRIKENSKSGELSVEHMDVNNIVD
ncbi:Major facilitator superfamily,Major facilitator superfamily domain [Cinara cedri]|uniref:Major facilitator superfamily,Major facilitator superfamily domain n=1 Tax=Cinara cedri TaxID=506608 RepID=A0A5E4M6N3_9HEMI|nr:Major facilitator superfamily,Major facilitator superfamily domain [Cinara cedri]